MTILSPLSQIKSDQVVQPFYQATCTYLHANIAYFRRQIDAAAWITARLDTPTTGAYVAETTPGRIWRATIPA